MSILIKNSHFRQYMTLLIVFVIICLLPTLFWLAISLLTIRTLLTIYKNLFKPDYGDFLCGPNNFFSNDDPYHQPLATVSGQAVVDGHVTLDDLRSELHLKFLEFEKKRPEPWFPELKQYLAQWMGFSIMKQETHFKIEEHVKLLRDLNPQYQDFEVTQDNVSNFCHQLSRIPFKPGTSPWELLVHHKVKLDGSNSSRKRGGQGGRRENEKHTVLFFRIHPTLGDSLVILQLLTHFCNEPEAFDNFRRKCAKNEVKMQPKQSRIQQLFYVASFPILGIYEVICKLLSSWDQNVWHGGLPKIRKNFVYTSFEPVPKYRINRIREKLGGVKYSSVFLTALTGGIRKYMVKNELKVPEVMHTAISIPAPGRANRLSNSLTSTIFSIPTGMNDRLEILKHFENEAERSKISRYPLMMLGFNMFFGLFPRKLLNPYWIFTTVATTTFPSFDQELCLMNHRLLNINAVATLPASTNGIYFDVAGFMDRIFVTLGVSEGIVSSLEELKEMEKFIVEELNALENPRNKGNHYCLDSDSESNAIIVEKLEVVKAGNSRKQV